MSEWADFNVTPNTVQIIMGWSDVNDVIVSVVTHFHVGGMLSEHKWIKSRVKMRKYKFIYADHVFWLV